MDIVRITLKLLCSVDKLKLLCSVEKELTEEDDFGSELRKCNPSLQKILVISTYLFAIANHKYDVSVDS